MANIPFLTIVSALIVCASSYTVPVPHISENPDLFIDDQLNLVEPKLDFWNVFLRPKTKSSFKNIVKMINNFDAKNKYVVGYNPRPISQIVPEELHRNSEVDETQYIIQEGNPGVVSEEVDAKESLSEEHSRQVDVGISLESKSDTSENSQSEETSKQSKESSEVQNKKEIEETNEEVSKSHSEDVSVAKNSESLSKEESLEPTQSSDVQNQLTQEPIRYRPSLPKSLHYFEIDRPRYQHSIRDGWVF